MQTICSEAIEKLEDTFRRLDKVVATAYPVSLQSLGIGNYVSVYSQFIPKKIYLTNVQFSHFTDQALRGR